MKRELEQRPTQNSASEPARSGRYAVLSRIESLLDELLRLALELPVDRGEEQVIAICIQRLGELMPDMAFGLLVQEPGSAPRVTTTAANAGPLVLASTGNRLFPQHAHERELALEGLADCSLHVATGDTCVPALEGVESMLVTRCSELLASAIVRARRFEQFERTSRELRRLQAQFIQAEKLASLGQVVAGVVHELNNPLTCIITYSEYLSSKGAFSTADPEDVERLRRIHESAERILKFSRDLVGYSRPAKRESGAVHLPDVIEKALAFCEHEFVEHHVRVEKLLPSELPPIDGVFDQLTQVFVNLFTNAAHAMSAAGGTLRVAALADHASGLVHVEVADEGIGIESTNHAQIFEPFFTTKPEGRGTGLGLSIVREIVTAHRGTLELQSTPERGSVFSLRFPLSPASD